jgi:hypothetical protein
MGGPCDQLIPAAILYDNPGLTLEEFSSKLYSAVSRIKRGDLKSYMPFDEYQMGEILHLRHTRQYRQILKFYFDNEFNYTTRSMHHLNGKYHVQNQLIKEITIEDIVVNIDYLESSYNKVVGYRKGDHIMPTHCSDPPIESQGDNDVLQAVEILETKIEQNDIDNNIIKQKIRARGLRFEKSEEEFGCNEDLVRKYPEYAPRKIYNFSQKTGILYPSRKLWKESIFMWKKDEERYYLDLAHLSANISPNSLYARDARQHSDGCANGEIDSWYHEGETGPYSLSDLVLTCEALRRRQWDVLRYVGFRHDFTDFIYSNEKTLRRYEQAVFDSETSVFARKQGWTYTELLMNRALWRATSQERQMPFEERVRIYKQWKKEHDEEQARLEREREAMREEEKEDEVPF